MMRKDLQRRATDNIIAWTILFGALGYVLQSCLSGTFALYR